MPPPLLRRAAPRGGDDDDGDSDDAAAVRVLRNGDVVRLTRAAATDAIADARSVPQTAIITLVTRSEYLIGAYALGASLLRVRSQVPRVLALPRKHARALIE